jgi:co-chaperonin GroES (HSP10)
MSDKIKPILDGIVIERSKSSTETEGGLYIPGGVEEGKPSTGTVIAMGPGRQLVNQAELVPTEDIAVGDTVVFDGRAGNEFKYDGNTYVYLKPEQIFCVIG